MNTDALRQIPRKLVVHCLRFLILVCAAALAAGCGGGSSDPTMTDAQPLATVPLAPSLDGGGALALGDVGTVTTNAGTTGYGIAYHGGPVLHGKVNAYYIWYGNWSGNTATSILTDFMNNLGGSPYYNINMTYGDSSGASVANAVKLGGSVFDSYSLGAALADVDVETLVANHIARGDLPSDTNGVYFVLTSSDVNETSGFCTTYCGWHGHGAINGADIKVAFVGNPDRCPTACEGLPGNAPNGNAGADGMASIIAHEIEETTNDPDLDAWYDSQGNESADKCAYNYGATYSAPNGAMANVQLGNRPYLIQQNWLNVSPGSCALAYTDFTISASLPALTVPQGSYGNTSIAIGGVGTVSLTVSAPAALNATLSPTSVSAGGSSTLSIGVGINAPGGTYTVTVTGTEGSIAHSTTVTVTVPPPDFTLSASPTSLAVPAGGSADATIPTTPVNPNANGTVSLSVSAPAGITVTPSPTSGPAGTKFLLTVAVAPGMPAGTYPVTVTGTEGSITHSTTVTVVVTPPDFGMTPSASSLTVPQGSFGNVTITTTTVNSSGTISFAASVPAGVIATFTPGSVTSSGTTTLDLAVGAGVLPGNYPITITGTEGSITHSTTITLDVSPANFGMIANPSTFTVPAGSSAASTLSITPVSGAGIVLLNASAPLGVIATLGSESVPTGQSTTLTLSANASAEPGSYPVTITGTEGGETHSITVTLVVPAPDFTLSASPSSLRVARDTSATSTVATTPVDGAGTVSLSATGMPAGVTASFDSNSVPAGQSATLTLSVDASAVTGSYTITITGTEGAETHSTTVTLTVTEPVLNPGFELGNFKDWTRAGTTSISTTAHGGTYSGECGASTPTGDVSMLIQTFVLPTTATTLSVWYNLDCLGTVDVDWAGAKLHDSVTGTILYLLPNTCTLGQGWQQASADVSQWAGHEVTLTLYNHDDGDPSTPTYTLFDDVHVGY